MQEILTDPLPNIASLAVAADASRKHGIKKQSVSVFHFTSLFYELKRLD